MLERLRPLGYRGGITIVRDRLRRLRLRRDPRRVTRVGLCTGLGDSSRLGGTSATHCPAARAASALSWPRSRTRACSRSSHSEPGHGRVRPPGTDHNDGVRATRLGQRVGTMRASPSTCRDARSSPHGCRRSRSSSSSPDRGWNGCGTHRRGSSATGVVDACVEHTRAERSLRKVVVGNEPSGCAVRVPLTKDSRRLLKKSPNLGLE